MFENDEPAPTDPHPGPLPDTYSINIDCDDDQTVIIHDSPLVQAQEALEAFRSERFAPVLITNHMGRVIPEDEFQALR